VNCIKSFDVRIQVEEERVLKTRKDFGCVLILLLFVGKSTFT